MLELARSWRRIPHLSPSFPHFVLLEGAVELPALHSAARNTHTCRLKISVQRLDALAASLPSPAQCLRFSCTLRGW